MPLSEKARIEMYLPDLPPVAYRDLLDALNQEFTYTFGGCTIVRGLDGSYLSRLGLRIRDHINHGVQATASSVRSCLAPASRGA